jgi:hypothetical protein
LAGHGGPGVSCENYRPPTSADEPFAAVAQFGNGRCTASQRFRNNKVAGAANGRSLGSRQPTSRRADGLIAAAAVVRRAAPAQLAPAWLRAIAAANPLAYAVDASRAIFNNQLADPSIGIAVAIMVGLASIAISFAARAFGRAVA